MESFHVILMKSYFRSLAKKRIRRPVQSVLRLRIPRIKAEIYDKDHSIKRSINNRAYVAILSLAASTFYVIGVAISWDQQITVLDFLSVPAF